MHITFIPTSGEKIKLKGIKEVRWVDRRLDSFAIGLGMIRIPLEGKVPARFLPAMGFDEAMGRLTSEICETDPQGQYIALIIVQNLWLNRSGDLEPEKEGESSIYTNDKLLLTAECYLAKEENYYAAFRIDSTFKLSKKLIRTSPLGKYKDIFGFEYGNISHKRKDITNTNAEAFEYCLNKLSALNPETLTGKRRPLEFAAISKYYQERTLKKIYTASDLRPGIFRSYADWEKAMTDTIPFRLNEEKATQYIDVLHPSGRWEVERQIWGFYDGQRFFVKSGDMYFPLVRIQHNFYYMGSLEISRFAKDDLFTPMPKAKYKHEYRPLKIDMLTGKLRD